MPITVLQQQQDIKNTVYVDFPTETLTIAGVNYEGHVLEQVKQNDFTIGGKAAIKRLVISIERSSINDSIPESGTLATFDGQTMRIDEVDIKDAAAPVKLTLTHDTLI